MFYFDSNTIVPLKCPELAFWKAGGGGGYDVWSADPFIPPSNKEHTFSVSDVPHIYKLDHQNVSQ